MKWSRAHIPTLREAPQDAEVISHKLMMRAGMIRKLASGIYSYLPLGWKAIFKLEGIIREEMNRASAEEVSLPVVQPREIWEEAGRWQLYGKELARFKDRHDNEFCLQPTSEEVITDLVRRDIKSYRQLPITLYQIQTKFRDEVRPRFGIMRGREFIMKDAYSFDLTKEGALKTYCEMRKAYRRIFLRSGLRFRAVDADTGAIGGNQSEEFSVMASSGEDEVVSCSRCDYGANQEKAVSALKGGEIQTANSQAAPLEKFATPALKSIEDLAKSTSRKPSELLKTMIATDKEARVIVVLTRGDHEIHELKLASLLSREKSFEGVRLATDEELRRWELPRGSLGPAKFPAHLKAFIVADASVDLSAEHIAGANEDGFHFKNLLFGRDATIDLKGVIRAIAAGEPCPKCGSALEVSRGIEVGHVFYLGKKYSKAMKCEVTTESGKLEAVEMGCYGIGVGRTIAAAIEQNYDEMGIIWPLAIAPYQVSISSLGDSPEVAQVSEIIYKDFLSRKIEVLWDDRPISPGVKLKDMDLIGIPLQIVVGDRGLKNGQVEKKDRRTQTKIFSTPEKIVDEIMAEISKYFEDLDRQVKEFL